MAAKLLSPELSDIRQFGNIEFLAKQTVEGFITGLHRSPYHGFSVEFAEHRMYYEGESTRHIDWKVFAKTDKLFVKKYEEETNLRCTILTDISSSMYYPEKTNGKLVFAVWAAACLAYMLQKQRDAVGLTLFSDKTETQTPVRSTKEHLREVHLLLEKTLRSEKPKQKKTAAAEVIHEIAEKIKKRSLVIILSDMFEQQENTEGLFQALRHLKHNKHEVLIFQITDKETEEEFRFGNVPYEFVDSESGERVKVAPPLIREAYIRSVSEFKQHLREKCHSYKIDLTEADIKKGMATVLQSYLVKRKKMV